MWPTTTSLRLPFAFFGDFECYGDITTTTGVALCYIGFMKKQQTLQRCPESDVVGFREAVVIANDVKSTK
jgi:hypothetical protein